MIKDVADLEVYNSSLQLVAEVYCLLKYVPASENDTINQLKRASKSVPANNSEGFAKKTYAKEFTRYLQIAIGSSDECITHLRTLYITVPKNRKPISETAAKYKVLSKRLTKLRNSWLTV